MRLEFGSCGDIFDLLDKPVLTPEEMEYLIHYQEILDDGWENKTLPSVQTNRSVVSGSPTFLPNPPFRVARFDFRRNGRDFSGAISLTLTMIRRPSIITSHLLSRLGDKWLPTSRYSCAGVFSSGGDSDLALVKGDGGYILSVGSLGAKPREFNRDSFDECVILLTQVSNLFVGGVWKHAVSYAPRLRKTMERLDDTTFYLGL